jgi:uncharacterized protein YecE (DUF72 family)
VASVAGNNDFRFSAKLYHSFTHERRPAPADEDDFKAGIDPLMEEGKLGALLVQFPWSFRNDATNAAYLWGLLKRFSAYPLVVEVRHASWMEDEVLDTLADFGVGLANIDQPLFKRSVKPSAHTTSGVGYVRLHGRNYKEWFSKTADVRARYDYLYSVNELQPWADRVKVISQDAPEVFAVANNHNFGKAAVNALEIKALLGYKVEVPPTLLEHYPELASIQP